MKTLHFTAENFEAEATPIAPVDGCNEWVITGRGMVPRSLRFNGAIEHGQRIEMLTPNGWVDLCWGAGPTADCLREAISLLYSVAGVEVKP